MGWPPVVLGNDVALAGGATWADASAVASRGSFGGPRFVRATVDWLQRRGESTTSSADVCNHGQRILCRRGAHRRTDRYRSLKGDAAGVGAELPWSLFNPRPRARKIPRTHALEGARCWATLLRHGFGCLGESPSTDEAYTASIPQLVAVRDSPMP